MEIELNPRKFPLEPKVFVRARSLCVTELGVVTITDASGEEHQFCLSDWNLEIHEVRKTYVF